VVKGILCRVLQEILPDFGANLCSVAGKARFFMKPQEHRGRKFQQQCSSSGNLRRRSSAEIAVLRNMRLFSGKKAPAGILYVVKTLIERFFS
jgi:hypothetical protein